MAPPKCSHGELQTDVSAHAEEAGYVRPPLPKRIAATFPSGRVPSKSPQELRESEDAYTFPGPLVLPDDDLALDSSEAPQSLRSWIQEKARNPLTQRRQAVYVGRIPKIEEEVAVMKSWLRPELPPGVASQSQSGRRLASLTPPSSVDIRDYLEAFYHGLPVKFYPNEISFVAWEEGRSGPAPDYVGLRVDNTLVRIRTRPCPDGGFPRQLNLNDILDALIETLPQDAHSFLLMVDHDLYEDDDDDFCCGRAYGGSRVAVVSSSRYHPALDESSDIDHAHMWPTSHCKAYIDKQCNPAVKKRKKAAAKASAGSNVLEGPLGAAIRAACNASDPLAPYALWLSRVARTASHELGHCFALAHCTYYACVMQSTAGMEEDVRQPPYLCPVCLSKVTRAMLDVKTDMDAKQYATDRYQALSTFCRSWESNPMFAGYGAWLDAVIAS